MDDILIRTGRVVFPGNERLYYCHFCGRIPEPLGQYHYAVKVDNGLNHFHTEMACTQEACVLALKIKVAYG